MSKLLSHIDAITKYRSESMVDSSLVQSLSELIHNDGHFSVTLFRVEEIGGRMNFFLSARAENGEIVHDEHGADLPDSAVKMQEAVSNREDVAVVAADGAGAYWFPIIHEQKLMGCVEINSHCALSDAQITLIDGMRRLYANYQSLLRYSQVDTLTGLLNRKTFDDSLQQFLLEAADHEKKSDERRGKGAPANWLGIIDIDHFKQVNDKFGHLFGDEVLIFIANIMRESFRKKDKLFRLGGEEFVVLLKNSPEANAVATFERFRKNVESHSFPQLGSVTVCVGLTLVHHLDDPSTLLGRADDALYYGKGNGRNQVNLYEKLALEGKVVQQSVMNTEMELF